MSRIDLPSRLQLAPGGWPSLIDGLCARFPSVGRELWQDRFARGRVLAADGRVLLPEQPWVAGMELVYFREVADEPVIPFAERIVFEDDHILVADKPHFLPVVPAGRFVRQTLLYRLMEQTDNQALVPLHRIDRLTAGLVMFSKRTDTRATYQGLFRHGQVRKQYEALATPLPQLSFPHERYSRMAAGEPFFRMAEVPGPCNAHTRIEVVETCATWWRYRLFPVTGRKHQLRVHMAALGAPLLGDNLYPELVDSAPDDYSQPLRLLAQELAFADPLSGEERVLRSSRVLLPDDAGDASLPDAAGA